MFISRTVSLAAVGVALGLPPGRAARAASVPYVGSVPITDAARDDAAWTGTIVARRSVPFLLLDPGFDSAYDLVLENTVVRARGTGTLDFFYRVTNGSDHPLRLIDMDTGRFSRAGSFDPVDVNLWDEATGTYAPLLADRGRSRFGGVALVFPEAEALAPGESSRLFFVRTPATQFELGGLTQFRSTPDVTWDNGFALTFNPVLEGPIVPPPAPVPPTPGPVAEPVTGSGPLEPGSGPLEPGSGPEPSPTPVPLPAGAWAGVIVAGGAVVSRVWRGRGRGTRG